MTRKMGVKIKGFTLIELMIVITIISIVIAIILPQIRSCNKYVPGTKVLKEQVSAPATDTLKKLGR